MKTIPFIIFLFCIPVLNAQTVKEPESQISEVVVYLRGAQVTRKATVNIPAGKSDILLKNITSRLNSNSLQVATADGVTLLSVNHSIDHLKQKETSAIAEKLVQKRDELQDSISLTKNTRDIFIKEREMLLSNQSIGGQESGVNVEQLIRATNFFRERLTEIEKLQFAEKKKLDDKEKRLEKINRQLKEINSQDDQPTSIVKVSVSANKATRTPIEVTYTVNQAHWQPFYDLRINDTDEPAALVYKAKVYQNTDENWDDVDLTLSTGDPSISNYKPELNPWFLYPEPPPPPQKSAQTLNIVDDDMELSEEQRSKMKSEVKRSRSLGKENVTTTQQQTTTAFEINIPYTIPSDNQGYDVAVTDHEIEALYEYATVPKLSPHVYLMAKMINQNDLNLFPGQANIYFDQTYQGKTHLDPNSSEDTLALSIGRDPGIIVKRELLTDYSSKSLFGNNRKETKAWKITVRNNKNNTVTVNLEDQYPISSNSDVKIDLEESSGAEINTETGLLTWHLELAPDETKELRLVYSVRYPKDMEVILD